MSTTYAVDGCGAEYLARDIFFGSLLEGTREHRGQSMEQAARRAGMDPDRWRAIEGGAQAARAERPLLARGLGMSEADLAPLILLCQGIRG